MPAHRVLMADSGSPLDRAWRPVFAHCRAWQACCYDLAGQPFGKPGTRRSGIAGCVGVSPLAFARASRANEPSGSSGASSCASFTSADRAVEVVFSSQFLQSRAGSVPIFTRPLGHRSLPQSRPARQFHLWRFWVGPRPRGQPGSRPAGHCRPARRSAARALAA